MRIDSNKPNNEIIIIENNETNSPNIQDNNNKKINQNKTIFFYKKVCLKLFKKIKLNKTENITAHNKIIITNEKRYNTKLNKKSKVKINLSNNDLNSKLSFRNIININSSSLNFTDFGTVNHKKFIKNNNNNIRNEKENYISYNFSTLREIKKLSNKNDIPETGQ